ncbi:MAG: phosphoribosyltransferase [cyanobacterium endosymbiont of Rhopalodia musculus]|uniref:phosphoribosyltransferase n=1 Tax=cyanobacterium endosymbiont of Epithemia clementina EcSB TaxID=3034674 RepID=UPI0024809F16|nr:phosphoribosyltransferase family protein [cyanobacterium endosymbiont of Epithemia clementina EcSB]WGT66660.1 phosphoribosyltransferase family protein [cyanobacterium endosymbiont of Epithemia clementina EcSB]
MSDLYVSWPEYHKYIENLIVQIYQSQWEFDQIVCLAKGGLRIGDILCRLYKKPLAILYTASYIGKKNELRGKIQISNHLAMIGESLGHRILLVDDLVDSGMSLQEGTKWLHNYDYNQKIIEIRSAVLWYKSCSTIKPDYYVEYLENNPWIHQPFEFYEQITPENVANSFNNHYLY